MKKKKEDLKDIIFERMCLYYPGVMNYYFLLKKILTKKILQVKEKLFKKYPKLATITKEDIYRYLGAEQFQKFVFKIEKIKYKIADKIPNLENIAYRMIDTSFKKRIREAKDENEVKALEKEKLIQKMKYRKEMVTRQNINYHYDADRPLEFVNHLNSNKEIHMHGLKFNIGAILAIIVGLIVFPNLPLGLIIPLLSFEVFSAFINFECVNLQNYNLERFKNEKFKKILEKKSELSYKREAKNYSKCSKKINEMLNNTSKIPSVSDTINIVGETEARDELLSLALKQKNKLKTLRRGE